MTFLQYLCTRLLGSPTSCKGELRWRCPACKRLCFRLRPHKPGFKDRFQCWGCNLWGDEADLLRDFHPGEPYDQRLDRLKELRVEYDRSGAATAQLTPRGKLSLSTGAGAAPSPFPRPGDAGSGAPNDAVAEKVWETLTPDEQRAIYRAWLVADDYGIGLAPLAAAGLRELLGRQSGRPNMGPAREHMRQQAEYHDPARDGSERATTERNRGIAQQDGEGGDHART
jgi:hypothetical protein